MKTASIAVIDAIDWPLLRKQKITLLRFVAFADGGSDAQLALEGIALLVDALQDAAVVDGIASEEQVFGVEHG
jgi:hypothetical protein